MTAGFFVDEDGQIWITAGGRTWRPGDDLAEVFPEPVEFVTPSDE